MKVSAIEEPNLFSFNPATKEEKTMKTKNTVVAEAFIPGGVPISLDKFLRSLFDANSKIPLAEREKASIITTPTDQGVKIVILF